MMGLRERSEWWRGERRGGEGRGGESKVGVGWGGELM